MKFFKSKDSEKITELENRINKLERELERVSNIRIGEFNYACFWSDVRPKIGIGDVIRLLISQQGLELKHTASSEKTELVKIKKGRA